LWLIERFLHRDDDERKPPASAADRMTVVWDSCPKCRGSEVVLADSDVGFGNSLNIRKGASMALGSWFATSADWAVWLCLDCGYYETYIRDLDKLAEIRADPEGHGWRRTPSATRSSA
jgi:predicted nucleic-acid-binding Zn-ribbon protein